MVSAPLSSEKPSPSHRAAILAALERLIDVIAQLRHPETGCPWDLAQTPTSLIPYVIEEAYEVVDAIQVGEKEAIAEELGDLLLQVVLQAQVASDNGDFDLGTVATGIADKLVRRHPHIFGDASGETPEEVSQNWDRIKAEEKGIAHEPHKLSPKLTKYSRTLPPLMAASKISAKAAKAGFEWDDINGVWDKFHEELDEFREALANEPKENQQAELGDLLFTLVNLARWYDLDPAEALQSTNRRFIKRFELVEAVAEKPLGDYAIDELEALWQQAKAQLAKPEG
ncbi:MULTISPECIES: nucleoside triphosphate pyrophosphohydrolase [Cyanophyceae]|uniref:nucleoside triphosphate pyrophosphohydrolase n=1 Tax=Cyanophyceae TaxID=3028117 RepID=UPI0016843CB5|nr:MULTISPECIES: nucleoside triphosphate pyrophosphohydrolase [Cyanophyceae]MBD1917719.1 nucleoside triphosphate pyrophosphohydrolase [Phormidium sp. FACHB-77]MBD2032838.1 nucleoside triphosphate pyrophosphohydrolase [Phormidium sp. FACHB-322]MBD2051585.1 nucleoside triphosphate pyrophosphohydrolase [Leptolyngbya sp. FACHB-60]